MASKAERCNRLAPLLENLIPLGWSSTGEATKENVVETLKFLFAENDELFNQINTLFSSGGAMFTMASQYIAAMCIIRMCMPTSCKQLMAVMRHSKRLAT